MKNNKKVLKIVFIILLVLVLLVNVSYALFSFVLRGTKENSISTANVSLNYTESTNGINTTNPTVMSDAEGMEQAQPSQLVQVVIKLEKYHIIFT